MVEPIRFTLLAGGLEGLLLILDGGLEVELLFGVFETGVQPMPPP